MDARTDRVAAEDGDGGRRWIEGTELDTRRRFAQNVERLRGERDLSLGELSARSMIDPEQIEEILKVERKPDADEIYLLAGALEVEPGVLMDGTRWIPGGRGGPRYEISVDGDQDV